MEVFDFSFINNIRQSIESEDILNYTITGFKAFAIALLGLKYLGKYFQNMDHEEPRLGGFMEVLGAGMIIISADWIIDMIENIFAQIKNFYDRWVCVRCDFDQVEIGISGDLPGFLNGYDTTVFPIGVN